MPQKKKNCIANITYTVSGDKSVHQVIDHSRKIAERCTDPADKETILHNASNLESMVNGLSELRQQGKVISNGYVKEC